MNNINSILVYYSGYGVKRLIGRLTMNHMKPVFSYDVNWINDGLPLSPLKMPLESHQSKSLYYGQNASAHYLCGLLSDSLPDGWGMLLMDRFFQTKLNKHPSEINVLDRLAYISETAMGALTFEPEHNLEHTQTIIDLLTLAQENQKVLTGQDSTVLEQLLYIGGSPQGARPKARVYYNQKKQSLSTEKTNEHIEPWLIKFPSQREDKSVCLLEYLYANYANKANLQMPEHHYFPINEEYSAFGVKRFDRNDHNQKIHIHTLSGLLDIDFRIPNFNYMQLLRCVRIMTRSQQQVENAYRQTVFNVIFNNKDDHTKNFSFIMNEKGKWSLSPAYDITFNTGINGYHQMDICGEAKHPSQQHLLQLAKSANINTKNALSIIDEITTLAENFIHQLQHYAIKDEKFIQKIIFENINRMCK